MTTTLDTKTATEVVAPVPTSTGRRLPRPSLGSYTGVIVAFTLVVVYMTLTQPMFLTWGNVSNIVASNSVTLILAIGATFMIIGGQFDLSAGGAVTTSGMAFGLGLAAGFPVWLAVPLPLLVGVLIGLVQGSLITYIKLSSIVVTLGFMSILTSIPLIANSGNSVTVFSESGFQPIYRFIGGSVAGVPNVMLLDGALLLLAAFMLKYTTYGRSLFAMGSNPEAARLNGINISVVILITFGIAGVAAGMSSVVQVGRLTAAPATVDVNLLLTAIAAVMIGGSSFAGGEGSVFGTALGVLFLGVIQNGMTLSGIQSFWQGVLNGSVLILAVAIGVLRTWVINRRRALIATPVG